MEMHLTGTPTAEPVTSSQIVLVDVYFSVANQDGCFFITFWKGNLYLDEGSKCERNHIHFI